MRAKPNLLGLVLLASSALVMAQEPQVKNAKLVPRSAQAGLQQEVNAIVRTEAGPAWIGYSVPVVAGEHTMCCFKVDKIDTGKINARCCGGCRLEREDSGGFFSGKLADCKQLEPAKNFFVLLRLSNHQIGKARAYSADCGLDVGGLTLFWLGEVPGAESIVMLEKLVKDFARDPDEESAQHAISAIAMHADRAADAALDRLVAKGNRDEVRQHAAFWLGSMRGHHGLETLRNLVRENGSEEFLEQLVFGISESKDPEAQPELIRLARSDTRSEVRGQALFWLAQSAGKKVGSVITEAMDQDPDTDVKKKAVFALTQMPNEEGVPLLIQVAKNNRNPVVRKEAIFWLGQSEDSRALDYIESILKK
jgi:HEAT repeat protein